MLINLAQATDNAATDNAVADTCSESGLSYYACERVLEWTNVKFLGSAADWIFGPLPSVLFILILAWIVSKVAQRVVTKVTDKIADVSDLKKLSELTPGGSQDESSDKTTQETQQEQAEHEEKERRRAEARAETIGWVLRSVVVALVWTFAVLMMLGELGINLGPLIAGAGIGGIALGFGAQTVVKDFLSGLFMIIEDQYGVGDVIDVGAAIGTVERVSLRSTIIRDSEGTVWHIPNSKIVRVANFSRS